MSGEIDTRVIEVGGIKYRVDLDPDDEAHPRDYDRDAYSQEAIAEFDRGDWRYVGVTETPVIDGIGSGIDSDAVSGSLGTIECGLSGSLWAVEYGHSARWVSDTLPDGDIDMDQIVSVHPVPDMIPEVRASLRKLHAALSSMPILDE